MGRRRNPDSLLRVIEQERTNATRGRLRIFLGMCPGVGKTYAMLKAAKEQLQRGTRVTVGIVETHGRKETEELLSGLAIYPRKEFLYKEAKLLEMDLDALLKDKPDLILVDELAHTNAIGSRHSKRYQDVEELLENGIDVYTTLNIQHIESRNDQVAQITGIEVRETVPDSFLEKATQIEVIDLSPKELLQRLHEGKVYLGDRAQTAAENFFKEEHLTALRELALRFTAEKVDQDLKSQMTIKGIEGPWNTNERLLVAISYSPSSNRLIRATRRMASTLEAPWVALSVDTGETLSKEDKEILQRNISLARELGAEVLTIADTSLPRAIQKICHEKNVTQIVMGRPDRRLLWDFIRGGTLLDQLVKETSQIDVHVIRAQRKPKFRGWSIKWPIIKANLFHYYYTIWFMVVVSFLNYALLPYMGYQALGSLFLLSILVVATLTTFGPILLAAFISGIVWNFFFIPPTFTFSISTTEDIMMLISFFLTAVTGGFLTSRIRRQEMILENREANSRTLYEFVQELSNSKDLMHMLRVTTDAVERVFGGQCTLFPIDKDGKISWSPQGKSVLSEKDIAVAHWVYENLKPAGWSTQTLSGSKCLCLPMMGHNGIVGVFVFTPDREQRGLSISHENLLQTILSQSSVAIERFLLQEAAQNAKLLEASELLHQTLLNSVSHELRTPITAIIGIATALKDPKTFSDDKARDALTSELVSSTLRLDRVVENLLDISRLQKGTLQLKNEWFDMNDLITEVKSNLKNELATRPLVITKSDTILIEGDFKLLSHALYQLVLNAVRYTHGSTKIEIEIATWQNKASIQVKDEGQGLPEGSEIKIFEKFFRLQGTPAGGLGLGLTIASNIIKLHGGTLTARNRSDRIGSIFEIILPLKTAPLELQEALR